MWYSNAFGHYYSCVSVCNALTFESLDPESSLLVNRYIYIILQKITGSRSMSQQQKVWNLILLSFLWQDMVQSHC